MKKVSNKKYTLDIETVKDPNIKNYESKYESKVIKEWQKSVDEFKTKKDAGETESGARTPSRPKLKSKDPALHWLTGAVCCVGMIDLETMDEYVLATDDEKKLLTTARKWMKDCGTVITFNGINFDIPFLIHRSAKNGVPITELPKLDKWAYGKKHIDVYDKLGKHWGLNCSLEEYAIFYEIDDLLCCESKDDIQKWYDAGEFTKIEKLCMGDNKVLARIVEALWEIF